MKKTILLLLILLLTIAFLFVGCKKEEAGDKTYIFASEATWPPFEYVDENGNLTGFEIELVAEIAKISGKNMVAKNVPWDGIFAGLANGNYDGVASGVTVTDERKMTLDFTTTIVTVTQAIIVLNDNAGLTSLADLSGKTVGVQMGTTGHFVTEEDKTIAIKAYDEIPLAVEDLLNGKVDAVVCDSLVASDFVLANENYANKMVISGTASSDIEEIAMCVKKGNTELLNILNESLAKLEANGTMDALKAKYNIL